MSKLFLSTESGSRHYPYTITITLVSKYLCVHIPNQMPPHETIKKLYFQKPHQLSHSPPEPIQVSSYPILKMVSRHYQPVILSLLISNPSVGRPICTSYNWSPFYRQEGFRQNGHWRLAGIRPICISGTYGMRREETSNRVGETSWKIWLPFYGGGGKGLWGTNSSGYVGFSWNEIRDWLKHGENKLVK